VKTYHCCHRAATINSGVVKKTLSFMSNVQRNE
jgi:hypothetical protein